MKLIDCLTDEEMARFTDAKHSYLRAREAFEAGPDPDRVWEWLQASHAALEAARRWAVHVCLDRVAEVNRP